MVAHERLVWVHHLIEIAVGNLAWASGCVETFGLVSDGYTCSGFASLCYTVFEGVLAPMFGGAASGVFVHPALPQSWIRCGCDGGWSGALLEYTQSRMLDIGL